MTTDNKTSPVERRLNALLAKVVRAQTIEELYRVARFRYDIYIKEQNKQTHWACPEFEALIEPADLAPNCEVLYIEENDKIVGSLRIEFEPINKVCADHFQIDSLKEQKPNLRFVLISRLMTEPSARQQSLVTSALFSACVDRSAEMKHQIGLISCKPHLVNFFGECGFRQYAESFIHRDAGDQVPMINMVDPEHLAQFSSLWAQSALRHGVAINESQWVEQITAPYANNLDDK
jgi:predicted GNAT family N-acyltransferase